MKSGPRTTASNQRVPLARSLGTGTPSRKRACGGDRANCSAPSVGEARGPCGEDRRDDGAGARQGP